MGAVQFNPVTRGYAVTLAPAGKYPIVGDRIFDTLQAAQDYVDGNAASKTAIPGIYLSVIADGDNNGAYWVAQAAGYGGATVGILEKMGEGGGGGITSIDFSLASDTTNAITLKINDTSKTITAATLKTSLGLKALAYKGSLAFSELTGKPTTLAGYGITNAVQKNSDGSVTLGSSINATAYYCRGNLVLSAGASNNRTLINYGTGRDLLLFGNNIMIKAESAYDPADESTTTIRLGVTTRIDGNLSLAKALRLCDSLGSDMSVMQMTSQNCLYIGQQSAQSAYDTYIFGHNLHFKGNSGASERLTILSGGNVGIGITSPQYKLHVAGAGYFAGNVTMTSIKIGDATISWDSSAGMLKIDKGVYSTGAITAKKKA